MRRFWVPGLGRFLLVHPSDIPCVVRAAWRLRREDWWRYRPWLPLPPVAYWDFRVMTVNGEDGHLSPEDVVAVAKWSDLQDVGR